MSLPLGSNTSSSEPDLCAIVTRVAAGDQAAMTTLFDISNRVIYGLLLRILSERTVAEEVLLDVYMQVWRQAGSYNRLRGSPLAWMLTIARSRAIDRVRSDRRALLRRQSIEGLETKTDADVETAVAIGELQRTVRAALAKLPIEQREVIELAYYAGLSHSEIALQLNQPLGTVKTRTRLGMMKLREILQPESMVL